MGSHTPHAAHAVDRKRPNPATAPGVTFHARDGASDARLQVKRWWREQKAWEEEEELGPSVRRMNG
jgi:hypothetical protein